MSNRFFLILYELLLSVTVGIALSKWRRLSKADKWIGILLVATFIQEVIAGYLKINRKSNFFTYHFYTPVEIYLIAQYFDRSIDLKPKNRLAIIIGLVGGCFCLINTLFFQPLSKINSYDLLFEGSVVLGLSLLSFYRLLLREDVVPGKMAQFWLTICFLFYWSLTYANFGLYGGQIGRVSKLTQIFDSTLTIANLLFYIGIAIVFIRYKKLIPSGE